MPKHSIYTSGIKAKAKKVAATNPVGSPSPTGDFPSPTVPQKGGQLHGLGPITKPFGHSSMRGAHGWGHVGKMKHGHLRLSGYANAHRLGARVPGKLREPPKTDQ